MDGSTLQQIKGTLLTRLTKLRQASQAKNGHPQAVVTAEGINQAEIIDIAQTLEQIDRDASLAEKERRELLAIERALAKIATGTFGFCEECGEEVPPKRLIVLPQARLCARCQTLEEKQQGRNRNTAVRGLGIAS